MPSSVEPARPAGHHPPGPPGPAPATPPVGDGSRVIPFGRRTTRTSRGHRTPQPPQPERTAAPDSPQQRLALDVEAWFIAHQATLTDEAAAHVYRTTLDFLQLMLTSSHAEERLSPDEYQHLTGMMQVLRDAPDAL
ncbi:hypothetical protein [Streptomyces californicus]|uniref:hypothetical protein n=1 Tax=Streptomyces californicus TaxID=67351 RepID=UPI0004BEB19F|nr:hypothetical protein [Streptomyces californicus]